MEAKRLGHEPVIITSDVGPDPSVKTDVRIIKIGKSLPIYSNGSIARVTVSFDLGRKVRKIIEREKFDILHIHSPFVPTLPFFFQRYSNTITVGTFHTHFSSSGFLRTFRRPIQKYFDGLHGRIAVSHLCVESMNRYFRGDYRIIPNGVDINKFYPAAPKIEKYCDDKKNIFYLGRLEPRNGLDYLIKAFVEVRKARSDCRLIIGGDGPLKLYYTSMVPASIADDVHFLGHINGVRPNYYATADIFCFPTTKASFGITILEAMAAGKPVVAFSMPAYEAMITSGVDGVLCGEPHHKNLANALNKLLDSPETRKKIGEHARARAEDFSWSKIAREVVSYYEELQRNSQE